MTDEQILLRLSLYLGLEHRLFWIIIAAYGASLVAYGLSTCWIGIRLFRKGPGSGFAWRGRLATSLLTVGVLLHALSVAVHVIAAGRLPTALGYEALSFFGFLTGVAYLLVRWRSKGPPLPGIFVSAIALVSMGLAAVGPQFHPDLHPMVPVLDCTRAQPHTALPFLPFALIGVAAAFELSHVFLYGLGAAANRLKRLRHPFPPIQELEELRHIGRNLVFSALPLLCAAYMWEKWRIRNITGQLLGNVSMEMALLLGGALCVFSLHRELPAQGARSKPRLTGPLIGLLGISLILLILYTGENIYALLGLQALLGP
jgi:ABC-type transport system involved in cytochrome c biogenesis permease subunit